MAETENVPLNAAAFIKEIGRGKQGARDMTRSDAMRLYAAMLEQRVSDLELGAILLSLRIKGESIDEIAGFLDAAKTHMLSLPVPPLCTYAPVVIPTYNGARKKANLTPLLTLLLAQRGVPVLVHGVRHDAGRTSTAEILTTMGVTEASNADEVLSAFQAGLPALMAIDVLSPQMARLLSLRRILGVRNSTHTLVKLLQPFDVPAVRLSSYTHPEYLLMLGQYFSRYLLASDGEVLMMRGTEGEVVANTGRAQQIDWFAESGNRLLVEKQEVLSAGELQLPAAIDAESTASWIREVLEERIPVPANIAQQVEICIERSRAVATQSVL